LSTPTADTEFTGEENSAGTTQTSEEDQLYEHVQEDGTVHYGVAPLCGGLCPHKPLTSPPPAQAPADA
jgi:hypothetical protein